MPELNFNFIQTLLLLGILQGAIFGVLIFRKGSPGKSSYFLALFLFSIAFSLATSLVLDFGLYNYFPELHWLPLSASFWLGPSFYFYVKFYTNPEARFRKLNFWHFSPIIFNYFHSIYHLVLSRANPYPKLHNFTEALEVYGTISMLIYFTFAFKFVSKYQKNILNQVSNTDYYTLKWIQHLFIAVGISLLFTLAFILIDFQILFDFTREFQDSKIFKYDDFLKICFVITIYWVSIKGHAQQNFIPAQISETTDGGLSTVDPSKHQEAILRLRKAMLIDQLYLNPNLNLRILSENLKLPAKEISAALNQGLGKNFYYFVNEYRVKEAQRRLINSEFEHLSILGIAFDSGFNSKATFNRIFKELSGLSPKEFKERHKK